MPTYYDDRGNPISAPTGPPPVRTGPIYYDDKGNPTNLPDSVAGRAAARLPRMRQEEQAAQTDVQNDTIGKGLGQAAGSAVFGLGADVMAKELDHPIASALTVGQYPILASMLPGMVKSAGNQAGKAMGDARTAITGSAGPNLPPATLPERGEAFARVLPRLGFAALAPLGIAGIADQADAIKTAPDPMAAAGRTLGSAAITAGAIPVSRLVSPVVKQSGANLGAAAERQAAGMFNRSQPMPEVPPAAPRPTILDSSGSPIQRPPEPPAPTRGEIIDRSVPQLLDKRMSFSSPKDLIAKANASGSPQLAADAETLADSMPASRTPGQILGGSAKAGGRALAEGAAGYAARKAGLPIGGEIGMAHAGLQLGRIALKTVQELAASPAWNSFSAVQKARLGSLMESGAYGDAISYAGLLSQTHNANDAQGNYYQKLMTKVPDGSARR